jgi:hypothetical protein
MRRMVYTIALLALATVTGAQAPAELPRWTCPDLVDT